MIEPRRILIADDHALFRSGLGLLLRRLFDAVEIAEARDVATTLDALSEETVPDLVLLDLAMPGMTTWEGLEAILRAAGDVPVVILSAHQEPPAIRACIEAGVRGYLSKSLTEENLRHALALIMAGEVYVPSVALMEGLRMSDTEAQAFVQQGAQDTDNPLSRLTKRQYEVVMLVMQGDSNKTIARKLGVYESTVKAHIQVILQKLNATNRTHAAMIVREWTGSNAPVEASP